MITLKTFKQRRQKLITQMKSDSAALFFAAPEVKLNNYINYTYRQNSNFWYFTGFNEPQSLLILIKKRDNENYSLLFNRPRDLKLEIWSGPRLGQEEGIIKQGVNYAFSWDELNNEFYKLLNGIDIIYHAIGENLESDRIVFTAMERLRCESGTTLKVPTTIIDWRPLVHEMRLFKSEEEIQILSHAGKITALAHMHAIKRCHVGMFEYQLEAEICYIFKRNAARFTSYDSVIASGESACILHYTANNNKMQDGDLVLVDAGCEFYGYASDITRTFPVNGKFTPPQRSIYNLVLASLRKALSMFRPGISIHEVNRAVVYIMTLGLIRLGILNKKDSLEIMIEKQEYCAFFMHGLSHWLGLDVHDVGHYGSVNRDRILEPGMVLTVEPGLYISSKDTNVPFEYRGIGVRIEDTIVITMDGHTNLTNSVVKNINDIENIMISKSNL